jgi:hypothetical protein
MYFVVYKNDNKFERLTFPNTTLWEELVSKIEGTVVEIFQNDKLEVRHFDDYFNATYRRKK